MSDIIDNAEDIDPLELGDEPKAKRGRGRPKGSRTSSNREDSPPRASNGKFASGQMKAISKSIAEAHAFVALPLMAVAPFTAQQLMQDSEAIGEAWMQAAEQNPKLRAALEQFASKSTLFIIAAAYKGVAVTAYQEMQFNKATKAAAENQGEGAQQMPFGGDVSNMQDRVA